MSTIGGIHIQGDATTGRALSNNNLAVPMNQRSYAWEKTHVTELFQDFANAIVNDEPEYFLGSIVVTQKGQSGRPEVVDGQQRLATSLILLAAIRDYFYNNKERARVIWVTVPDDTNAYVMFETLNDRGLELSKADLLKNYLFGRSQDRSSKTQQRWFSMMGALETVGNEDIVVTYIRHL